MTIIKLDDQTIEKIAAGEVIESPVSIIKELVENSIDSGADTITVEIKNGGKTYIRVTDNGCGIARDEIELAFSKHATSKIKDFNDLYDIYSLGFRGEALASIVTVSQLTAISKTEFEDIGSKINFNNGKSSLTSIATNTGTSIVVKDLFRDIPVRRRFLKSDIIEANRISRLMYAFAIGYKDISFKFIKNDNIEFSTNKNEDLKVRISKLIDDSLGENLISLKAKNDVYKINGYISNSNYYRGNRSLQYIYINNRLVDSDLIRDRIELNYRGLIPNGRFPVYFIYISTNPKNLDVNVHPNKRSIKFSYEDELIELIDESLSIKLGENNKAKEIDVRTETSEGLMDFSDYGQILNKYNKVSSFAKEDNKSDLYKTKEEKNDKSKSVDDFFNNNIELDMQNDNVEDKRKTSILNKNQPKEEFEEQTYLEDFEFLSYKCSIFERYSIFEKKDELYILDHRRASEKINFEKFIKQLSNKSIDKQILLDPILIKLNRNDFEKFISKKDFINNLGFDAEIISDESIIIRSTPFIFEIPENDKFFYDLIDIDYDRDIDHLYNKLRKVNLSYIFRKGDKIGEKEAFALIKDLSVMDNPYKTSDGKATLIKINEKDVEKYFER